MSDTVSRFIENTLMQFSKTYTPDQAKAKLLGEISGLYSRLMEDLDDKTRREIHDAIKAKQDNYNEILNDNN